MVGNEFLPKSFLQAFNCRCRSLNRARVSVTNESSHIFSDISPLAFPPSLFVALCYSYGYLMGLEYDT